MSRKGGLHDRFATRRDTMSLRTIKIARSDRYRVFHIVGVVSKCVAHHVHITAVQPLNLKPTLNPQPRSPKPETDAKPLNPLTQNPKLENLFLEAKPGDRVQVIGVLKGFPPPMQAESL